MISILLKNYPVKLLEKKFKIEKDVRVWERLQMMLHLRRGYTQREVASMLRVSHGLVPFWKKRFEEEGFSSGDRFVPFPVKRGVLFKNLSLTVC